MKTLMRYLAQNVLLIALIIIASYQQFQLLELTSDVAHVIRTTESGNALIKFVGDDAGNAAFYGEENSNRLISMDTRLMSIENNLWSGTYPTNCSN